MAKRSNVNTDLLNIESNAIIVGANIIYPAYNDENIQETIVNKLCDCMICIACVFVVLKIMIDPRLGTKYLIEIRLRIEEIQLSIVTCECYNVFLEEFLHTWWYKYSTGIIIRRHYHCRIRLYLYSSWILRVISKKIFGLSVGQFFSFGCYWAVTRVSLDLTCIRGINLGDEQGEIV